MITSQSLTCRTPGLFRNGIHSGAGGPSDGKTPTRRCDLPQRAPMQAWENEGGRLRPLGAADDDFEQESMMSHSISAPTPADSNLVEEMAKHGITRSAADVFHVDGYRYSNLRDAIAQSQRTRSRVARGPNSGWRTW